MKFVRFLSNGQEYRGILEGESIRVIDGCFLGEYRTTEQTAALADVTLLSPVTPSKVICIGLNYRDHAMEVGIPLPTTPVVFMKASTAVIGAGQPIVKPAIVKHLDYECELGVVIGKTAKNVSEVEAPDYVFGYTCANDVTARDYQKPDGQWIVAKGFDTFAPLGPCVDTEADPTGLDIRTVVNGEVKQHSNTKNLIFTVPFLVSYLSKIMTLLPGDVIITGTPSGISRLDVGDTVTIEIEGIGSLTNRVVQG